MESDAEMDREAARLMNGVLGGGTEPIGTAGCVSLCSPEATSGEVGERGESGEVACVDASEVVDAADQVGELSSEEESDAIGEVGADETGNSSMETRPSLPSQRDRHLRRLDHDPRRKV